MIRPKNSFPCDAFLVLPTMCVRMNTPRVADLRRRARAASFITAYLLLLRRTASANHPEQCATRSCLSALVSYMPLALRAWLCRRSTLAESLQQATGPTEYRIARDAIAAASPSTPQSCRQAHGIAALLCELLGRHRCKSSTTNDARAAPRGLHKAAGPLPGHNTNNTKTLGPANTTHDDKPAARLPGGRRRLDGHGQDG